ncbi:hypothetical protein JCM8547_002346 [Rhodosporidiobolus lusitaniae]
MPLTSPSTKPHQLVEQERELHGGYGPNTLVLIFENGKKVEKRLCDLKVGDILVDPHEQPVAVLRLGSVIEFSSSQLLFPDFHTSFGANRVDISLLLSSEQHISLRTSGHLAPTYTANSYQIQWTTICFVRAPSSHSVVQRLQNATGEAYTTDEQAGFRLFAEALETRFKKCNCGQPCHSNLTLRKGGHKVQETYTLADLTNASHQSHEYLAVYGPPFPVSTAPSKPLASSWTGSLLGRWLGDGVNSSTEILAPVDEFKGLAEEMHALIKKIMTRMPDASLRVSKRLVVRSGQQMTGLDPAATKDLYRIAIVTTKRGGITNPLIQDLKRWHLHKNKSAGVPSDFFSAPEPEKLGVIAGLLNSDGSRLGRYQGYAFSQTGFNHEKIVTDLLQPFLLPRKRTLLTLKPLDKDKWNFIIKPEKEAIELVQLEVEGGSFLHATRVVLLDSTARVLDELDEVEQEHTEHEVEEKFAASEFDPSLPPSTHLFPSSSAISEPKNLSQLLPFVPNFARAYKAVRRENQVEAFWVSRGELKEAIELGEIAGEGEIEWYEERRREREEV